MACHAIRRPPMCVLQRILYHSTPDVVQPYALSTSYDGMPHAMSSGHVCNPRAMIKCHARHRLTVPTFRRRRWDATPDIFHLCVISKGYDPRLTSFNHVCCPSAMMLFHAQCRPTVFPVQGLLWHATPHFVQPCVLSKGDDSKPRPTLSDHVY